MATREEVNLHHPHMHDAVKYESHREVLENFHSTLLRVR